ncbi:nitronate monooxygenase [Christensenellaceae bacterium OttesenSCG-928-M15]|nr:nitronate monooxygenase [Christensenellaceae bacterium OttesenSCG-928-M15]
MLHTEISAIFGIQYPIFQGGMAWVSDASLAGAVSSAGGLGIISAMNADADYVRGEIRKCRAMTSAPFGVNIMLMSPHVDEVANLVLEERVPVVTTGAGLPSKYMKDWIDAGIKVVPVVASTGFAKMVARSGATAVIAEGGESGGHIGELTTMALVPQVCDAVNIPVLAAGGIGDGRGIAAAMMLGAKGVQCGTRFLTAHECTIHENYKTRVIKAKDIDTIATGKRLGHPVRALKNSFTRQFAQMELDANITTEQIERFGTGAVRKAAVDGNEAEGSFLAGQIAGMIKDALPAKEIIERMFHEAETILKGASQWVK